YPSPADPRFSSDDLNNVKKVLLPEVNDVANLTDYLDKLQKPITDTKADTYVNLEIIGKNVVAAVDPNRNANTQGLQLFIAFVNIAKIFADVAGQKELKIGLDIFTASLSLVALLARSDGTATLPDVVNAKVNDLITQMPARLNQVRDALITAGLLIVSDAGKLRLAGSKVNSDWNLPAHYVTNSSDALKKGSEGWFYQSLMPVAFHVAQVNGVNKPQEYLCFSSISKNGQPNTSSPFRNLPDPDGWDRQVVGFQNNGAPITYPFALYSDLGTNPFGTPTEKVVKPLFAPGGPGKNGLGLSKTQLYSRNTFSFDRTLESGDTHRCPYG
ncbi:MAG TPA: hypothetical protein VF005_04085, partial [Acidimicrobiales bacterium]